MKRIQKIRKTRDTILIITNGKQTEKNYFNNLTSSFISMYSITVKFYNEQCDKLIEYAISQNRSLYNQIWCVFDIDDTLEEGHLLRALNLANSNGINIAYSNESFEVWLLNHLAESVKPGLSRKTYTKEINRLFIQEGYDTSYKKNDEELLKTKFIPHALEATQRAKKTYQKKEAEYQREFCGNKTYPIWEWKSTTTVYKLIEELQLKPKEPN